MVLEGQWQIVRYHSSSVYHYVQGVRGRAMFRDHCWSRRRIDGIMWLCAGDDYEECGVGLECFMKWLQEGAWS